MSRRSRCGCASARLEIGAEAVMSRLQCFNRDLQLNINIGCHRASGNDTPSRLLFANGIVQCACISDGLYKTFYR